MSKIHPQRAANSLTKKEANELVKNIKSVLEKSIQSGGSTLKDFANADGSLGEFQDNFLVYDCENKKCQTKTCNSIINRIVQGGRSTFYCPTCQK